MNTNNTIDSLMKSNNSFWKTTKIILYHKNTIPPIRYRNKMFAKSNLKEPYLLALHLKNNFTSHSDINNTIFNFIKLDTSSN